MTKRGTRSEAATELTWDSANRLTVIAEGGTTPSIQNFGYDANDRLTSASIPLGAYAWTYDAVGNRLTQGVGGTTTSYAYETGKQRLASTLGATVATYTYDATGNQTAVMGADAAAFQYNAAGRMAGASVGTTTANYSVNGLGQRALKKVSSGGSTTVTAYAYDESGHLLGEYDAALGAPLQETVWLGDLPVATIKSGVIYRVHPDHLGTPRKITDTSGYVRWRWDSDPFGSAMPNDNPAGSGTFTYNLRFPGQVYDAETGLHQNWFRDYQPALGRYVQSDPIGQTGGLNLFSYAQANPLYAIDPRGLMGSRGNPNAYWQSFPNGSFVSHGLWCGPGWTGGVQEEYSPTHNNKYLNPIDILDGACKTHDICYYSCRANNPCDPGGRSTCFAQCDAVLASDASKIGGQDAIKIEYAMRRWGTRAPGPNQDACYCQPR